MAEKTFINNSLATIQFTLFISEGDNPIHENETVSFTLNPEETKLITIGKDQNIFLNGIKFSTTFGGDHFSGLRSVTLRESELDNLLNLNNVLTITKVHSEYEISGSNISVDNGNDEQATDEIQTAINNSDLGIADNDHASSRSVLKQLKTFRNFFRRS